MNEEKSPFNEFNWDSEITDVDFFGEIQKIQEEVPEKEEKKEEEKSKEEEIEEEKIFEDLVEEQEENSSETLEKPSTGLKDSLQYLIEQGIIELDENEELPESVDNDYLTDIIDKSIEKRFEESIKNLPEDLKNIIKYVNNGGSLEDIITILSESSELSEDIDLSDESNQEKVLRYLLKQEGEDDEIIEANIEFLKDSGKLAAISEKKFEKWKNDKKTELEMEVENQKKQKQLLKENQIKFKKDISEYLSSNNEIKGLTISKNEEKELPSYISDTSIKLQDGRQITPFYRDLFEALKDREKIIALAKIIKSDFDFSSMKKNIVTKQTQKLKEEIQRQEKSTDKRSSQKTRLIDLL